MATGDFGALRSKRAGPTNQGKTSRVDSACVDCPGFGVLGAAPAPASTFVSEPQIIPLGVAFALWAFGHLLGSAARSSLTTRAETGRPAQIFTAQGGARRKIFIPRTSAQNACVQ